MVIESSKKPTINNTQKDIVQANLKLNIPQINKLVMKKQTIIRLTNPFTSSIIKSLFFIYCLLS